MLILKGVLIAAVLPALLIVVLGIMVACGPSQPAAPLAAVSDPMRKADFSTLPPVEHVAARDGTPLAFRTYPGGGRRVAVLIHGSSGPGSSVHVLAQALAKAGVTVLAPDVRGHGGSGRSGDIDYLGQLDDDLADLAAYAKSRYPGAPIGLVGFSSGGGFALRIAGGGYAGLFNRYVLIAPVLYYDAPTNRPNSGGWASVATARIIALTMLERLGVTRFDGATVVRFAGDPETARRIGQTLAYSMRLQRNFGAPQDYLDVFRRAPRPLTVLIGAEDRLLYPAQYVPLLKPVRPDLPVEVLPGLGHMEMTLDPRAAARVAAALEP